LASRALFGGRDIALTIKAGQGPLCGVVNPFAVEARWLRDWRARQRKEHAEREAAREVARLQEAADAKKKANRDSQSDPASNVIR
jgi:hypothetical protein